MSVVAAIYRHGKLVGPVSLDTPLLCADDRSEFVWIGLHEPSEQELRHLQENFDLHPLAVEDALTAHQLPKVDVYGDQLFVVARPAQLEDGRICYGETSVFVGEPSSSAFDTARRARTPTFASSWKLRPSC